MESRLADFGAPDSPTADKVMHAQFDTAKDVPHSPGNNVAVYLGGDGELREYFEKLSVGGTVTMPLEKQLWGDEAGALVDQFGISWMFNITRSGAEWAARNVAAFR
ncbi:hypothetical protein [Amycolatopsis sp. WAC 04197]|uniref:hypothetical protein n=1 Tax=Amycolatopsis sp. WAC 04197 TaxID=2203199 RepID=UPI0018F2C395|nr:hypothetical protein [Amycolatopsis sp. WAC 04197]